MFDMTEESRKMALDFSVVAHQMGDIFETISVIDLSKELEVRLLQNEMVNLAELLKTLPKNNSATFLLSAIAFKLAIRNKDALEFIMLAFNKTLEEGY